MKIIRAIVAGERDPDALASLRDVRYHSSVETIRASLIGNDRDEHVFALSQSLELYDFYQLKMLECDRQLEASIASITEVPEAALPPLPKVRTKTNKRIHRSLMSGLHYTGSQGRLDPDSRPRLLARA